MMTDTSTLNAMVTSESSVHSTDKTTASNCWMFIKTRGKEIESVRFHLIYADNRSSHKVKLISGLSPLNLKKSGAYVMVSQYSQADILLSDDNNALSLQRSEVLRGFGLNYCDISVDKLFAIANLMYEL